MNLYEALKLLRDAYSWDNERLEQEVHKALNSWERVEGFPNYWRHRMSGVVKGRQGVLKPNKRGQVRMHNKGVQKWILQGDLEFHNQCTDKWHA